MWYYSLLLLSNILTNVNCARILAVYPIPSYSHHIIYNYITLELHSRGHEMVVITTNPLREKAPKYNYTEIDLSVLHKDIDNRIYANGQSRNRIEIVFTFAPKLEKLAHTVFSHKSVQDIIHGNFKFDMVLLEWSAHPSFCAFSELFQCPLVGVRPMVLKLEGNDAIGNPFTPSYMPLNYMHYENDFWGRFTNTFLTIFIRIYYNYVMLPRADNIVHKYFKNHSSYIGDIEKNVSIVLANTYPVLNGPRPLVPALIEIGGLHLHKTIDENLPEDIIKFLDDAKNGAILFSFGTIVRSSDIQEDKLNIFKEAFSELPYKVLWKWAPNTFKNKPANVKLYKWIPQRKALAHPNMRLFITHGGLHSVEESLANQIPFICIPFFADQYCNCRQINLLGTGIRFDMEQLTKEILVESIKEVIQNSSYKENARNIGKILLDQPVPALEKTMWWIEYVLRYKGAKHLRTEAVGMPWYTYYSIDVLMVAMTIFCFIYLFMVVFSKLVFCFVKYPQKKEKVKKNTKVE